MTAIGAKRYNATGRSIGARKTNARTRIQGQFAPRLIDMLRSPAYRVLSLSEHRILARLEIELAEHGGADNGRLPCTFDDFGRYGVRRHSVAPALRALRALGFIEITEIGRAGNAEWRRPNLFRLTYCNTGDGGPTHEWQKISGIEEAEAIASVARSPRGRKRNSSVRNGTTVQCRNGTINPSIHGDETYTTAIVTKPSLLSISRVPALLNSEPSEPTRVAPSLWLTLFASSREACVLFLALAQADRESLRSLATHSRANA